MISMAKKWERSGAIVAQRMSISQIGGFVSKKIQLSDGEAAILEKEGSFVRMFENGKHKVSGMFSGPEMNVVFIDKSPKSIHRGVQELWTKDDKKINADIEMKFSVSEPEKVRKLLMGRRDVLVIEDIWMELRKEIVSSSLTPIVKKKGIDDLQDERMVEKEIRVAVEVEAKKKFEVFGLELISFSVEFILPEDYQEYLKRRGDLKEDAEKAHFAEEEDTRKAVHERNVEEIKGAAETREQALDEMERERIKREAEMQIEGEETQQDMKDAMEALKLKEIKDKQKIIRDSERKNMGLESLKDMLPGSGKKIEEQYDHLQDMVSATEKKYFQRKIDKGTFTKMMEDLEKEKTDLEVRMMKKKK